MAILDDILNKNKNKGANSFLPFEDNNRDEQADNTPIVGDGTKPVTAQQNIQAEQSAALPDVKYPNKPQGLNDSDYEYLLKYRSPEEITKFSAPFDPNSGENIFQRYYKSTMPKPTAPDEKKMRNKRIIAGIGDGLSMLSQMISAGSGAHVRERNDFSLPKIQQQEKEEQNRYLQLSQRYNDGLFQARVKDFQKALDDYNNGRKGIQSVLATKQKLDQTQAQFEEKQRFAYNKLAKDQANKDKDYELRKQNTESQIAQRKALVAQGWSRVADSHNRTSAYVKNISSGGKNGYQMIFLANPNDKNARMDEFGNSVVEFNLTKGQIDQYAREALADKDFMNSATGKSLIKKRGDAVLGEGGKLVEGAIEYKPALEIAAAYIKEKFYDKQFETTPAIPSTATPPIVDWGNMLNYGYNPSNAPINDEEAPEGDESDDWNWID